MARKKPLPNLSAFQILMQSEEELSDEFKEELGDWIYQSLHEFFDENEAPCEIRFALMLNEQEINLH